MNIISCSVDEWTKLVSQGDGEKLNIPVWFQSSGNSMLPFIRPQSDKVMLVPVQPEELKTGDIVLFPWHGATADYCLHRVYKIDGDRVQTFGDGNLHPDGWISKQSVLGRAVLIHRGEKEINCDDPKWVRRSDIWRSLRCIRRPLLFLLRAHRKIGKIFSRKK